MILWLLSILAIFVSAFAISNGLVLPLLALQVKSPEVYTILFSSITVALIGTKTWKAVRTKKQIKKSTVQKVSVFLRLLFSIIVIGTLILVLLYTNS